MVAVLGGHHLGRSKINYNYVSACDLLLLAPGLNLMFCNSLPGTAFILCST